MPRDSLLLSIVISGVFLLFAVVLSVIDHRTSKWLAARAAEKHKTVTADVPYKAA